MSTESTPPTTTLDVLKHPLVPILIFLLGGGGFAGGSIIGGGGAKASEYATSEEFAVHEATMEAELKAINDKLDRIEAALDEE